MTIRTLFLFAILGCASCAETVNFTYDEAGRLVRVRYGSGRSIEYTYDKSGNLLRRVVIDSPAPPSVEKKTVPPRRDRPRTGAKAR